MTAGPVGVREVGAGWRDKGSNVKGTGRQFEISSRPSGEKSHL